MTQSEDCSFYTVQPPKRLVQRVRSCVLYTVVLTALELVVLNVPMSNQPLQHRPSLGQFLTAVVIVGAIIAAALLWNSNRPLKMVEIDGWSRVAEPYRDSVTAVLKDALANASITHLRQAEILVERFPFVRNASAHRIGSTLHVSVVEREPLALVRNSNHKLEWLTADSTCIPYAPYYGGEVFPIVHLQQPAEIGQALNVLRQLPSFPHLAAACSELTVDARGNVTLTLEPTGARMELGSHPTIESKLAYGEWLLQSRWWHPSLRCVDLRWSQRIILPNVPTTARRVNL